MPETTDFLKLEKPFDTENYSIGVFNRNADKLDAEAAAVRAALGPAKNKDVPANADRLLLADSADGSRNKWFSWSSLVTAVKKLFYTKDESDAALLNKAQGNPSTGAAVDSEKLGGQAPGYYAVKTAVDEALQKIPRENLLANWELQNPVNSQGKLSYEGTGETINCWKGDGNGTWDYIKFTLQSNGIKLHLASNSPATHCRLAQKIPNPNRLKGQNIIFSANISEINSKTAHIMIGWKTENGKDTYKSLANVSTTGMISASATLPNQNLEWLAVYIGGVDTRVSGESVSGYAVFSAAKLELGTTSTLAYDPPGNYEMATLKSKQIYTKGETDTALLSKANILPASRTLYVNGAVAASGNGTQSAPFKTIQEAINSLPKFTQNGSQVTINVAAGTYAEIPRLSDLGYTVRLRGEGTEKTSLAGVAASRCEFVYMDNFKVVYNPDVTTYGIAAGKKTLIAMESTQWRTDTSPFVVQGTVECTGMFLSGTSCSILNGPTKLSISGCYKAIHVLLGGNVFMGTLPTVSPVNTIGIISEAGSVVSYLEMQDGFAQTKHVTTGGGRIYTGAQ